MINNIIDAMSITLHREYPHTRIYTEDVSQGLTEPCFLITSVLPTNDHFLNNRYKRKHLMVVQYFPSDGLSEINSVLSDLFIVLEEVTDLDGNTHRGSKMRIETVGNVGHFFIHYDFFVDKHVTVEDPMEDLAIDSILRS